MRAADQGLWRHLETRCGELRGDREPHHRAGVRGPHAGEAGHRRDRERPHGRAARSRRREPGQGSRGDRSSGRDANGGGVGHNPAHDDLRPSLPHFLSLNSFNRINPFSKSGPTVRSMLITRHIALPMKLCLPDMVQITLVRLAWSEKMNSESLVPPNGLAKSVRMRTRSFGLLSVMVMVPAPTLSLPDQWNIAPEPAAGPSNETLAFKSSFAQGDQSSHWRRSLTCGKISAADVAIVVERVRR